MTDQFENYEKLMMTCISTLIFYVADKNVVSVIVVVFVFVVVDEKCKQMLDLLKHQFVF